MTMKTRPCALCKRSPRLNFVTASDLCEACYEYSGWENTHSDEGHDGFVATEHTDDCPICRGVPAPWTVTEEISVNTQTMPRSRRNSTTRHMSHASCSHPRTPAGRASCRKAIRTALAPEPTFPTAKIGKGAAVHLVREDDDARMTSLCSGGKREVFETIDRLIKDVTCKNCLKLHN